MAMEGSRGASWSDKEEIALISEWGDSQLHTKPTHSRRPAFLFTTRQRKNKTAAQVVLGYVMRPAHD